MFQVIKDGRSDGLKPTADHKAAEPETLQALATFKGIIQLAAFVAFVGAVFVLNRQFYVWAYKQDALLPKPSVSAQAGAVLDVDLHPSMLFNTTTVRSTTGQIYQVKGAVSAAKDDVLTTKTKEPGLMHLFDGSSLCVQSQAGQACYPLL